MKTYLQKLAQLLIDYSLEINPGDVLRITAGAVTMPLYHETYRAAIRAGAFVIPRISDPTFQEILLREGSDEQLQWVSPFLRGEIEHAGKWLDIVSDTNTRQFASINPERIAMNRRASQAEQLLFDQRAAAGKLQWCVTTYPTEAMAQEAGMSLLEYTDFVDQACLLDDPDPGASWQRIYETQQTLVAFLAGCRHIRIVAPGTELEYECGGRRWVNCAGKINLPDGEVFTGPIEDSMSGHMRVAFPSIYGGTTVDGIELGFERGKVVKATARHGQQFLEGMLNMDAGARFVGEVAFGTNYGIQRATGNALFDEKIGGTMHLALGSSYPETGGVNESALHWDLVADLRDGEVYADGELCYKAGRFLI